MQTPAVSFNPFRVLQVHRNFRIFWLGQTTSLIGSWMQSMAQGWLALELTNSALMVGVVASAGSLPILLFSLHAGVLVDRYDKLRIVKICQTLLLFEATALWWLTWSGHITIGWLITLAAINGAIGAVEIPARQAMQVDLVGRADLRDAIALNSSGFNLARIVGPTLAAVVIASAGLAWCFGVNAISYLAVLVGLFMIHLPPPERKERASSPWFEIKQGIRYMTGTREVAILMTLVTAYSVLGVPYLTLMPVVARDLLGLTATGYGTMLIMVGIGGLTGALFLAGPGQRISRGKLLPIASYSFGVLLILVSMSRSIAFTYPLLVLTGFMMIMTNALSNALLQMIVPDAFRGRLLSVYSFVVVGLSQVVGALAAGAVARVVGVEWAIGVAAAIMLGFSITVFNRFPEIKRL
jgi:MFS family permease